MKKRRKEERRKIRRKENEAKKGEERERKLTRITACISGVAPKTQALSMSTPASTSIRTASSFPMAAAWATGVNPELTIALLPSAPFWSRKRATSRWPLKVGDKRTVAKEGKKGRKEGTQGKTNMKKRRKEERRKIRRKKNEAKKGRGKGKETDRNQSLHQWR